MTSAATLGVPKNCGGGGRSRQKSLIKNKSLKQLINCLFSTVDRKRCA